MFDPQRHQAALQRACAAFRGDQDFLMNRVVDDLMDRLAAVNRDFRDVLALFGRTPQLAEALRADQKIRHVLRVEERPGLDNPDHIATPDLLDLPEGAFDLALAPFNLHWANDLPGTLIQVRRALRPDGLFMAVLPGAETLQELRESLLVAESELSAGAGMRIDPLTDIRDAGALLQRAGFALPVVDRDIVTVRYSSVSGLIRDLRAMGAGSQLQNRQPNLSRQVWNRAQDVYQERFADPDGRLRATFSCLHLSGWAPDESQQKPLRPGSARTRLADALGTDEVPLKP